MANMQAVQSRIERALSTSENILLFGPPETGKSEFVRQWTSATSIPLSRFPVTRGASGQSLFGSFAPKGAGWTYTYGAACRAALAGGLLLLDDIHVAGADLESALYTAADRHEIELAHGEIVAPKAGYRVVATSNESPDSLPEAVASRFPIQISVPAALPSAIAALSFQSVRTIAEANIGTLGLRQCYALDRIMRAGQALGLALRIVTEEAQAVEIENALAMRAASGVQR